jgi:tRNA threonylcarbamoyladenosine biosynthesis protein TsaE
MKSMVGPHLNLPDAAATRRLGRALAAGTRAGGVLHLSGDLGAGKTTLVRGLLEGLGHAGRVKSPTYTLVEPYNLSSLNLYHFDFYRFKNSAEWLGSGFQDYFNPDSVCIVEWPERAGTQLAPPDLSIQLELAGEAGRTAKLTAHSAAGGSWLSEARSRLSSA